MLTNAEFWIDPAGHPLGNASLIMLAKDGYDVWLGNVRGTRYGNVNDFMAYDSAEFWDFSTYEQGLYDIPAMQDLVVATTG